jgi:LytS/YehU family sensor histidine kinase
MIAYTTATVYILIQVFLLFGFRLGSMSGMLYGTVITTSIITIFLTSRSFLFKWRQAAIDKEKFQKEGMAARYESLKNQVNPHFLFNTLNALTNLVYEDQDKAAKFIKQLSEVYRYVLETRERELVPLGEEKNFLEAYLFLQQIRFGDKLKLEVSLDGKDGMVAPLVLQMLIENAIKHNIISEEKPLTVHIFCKDDYLIVENTLQKKEVLKSESPGVGLENICRRYEFLTDKEVIIRRDDKFVVKLPLIPVPA